MVSNNNNRDQVNSKWIWDKGDSRGNSHKWVHLEVQRGADLEINNSNSKIHQDSISCKDDYQVEQWWTKIDRY
jgi:hypothetical protein